MLKNDNPSRFRRIECIVAIVLSVVLIGLNILVLLNRGPLWRDEISSLTLATKTSWGELWKTLVLDPFPPFFFVLLRGWHALVGDSDFSLRILGFGIGLSCIAAFWVNARLTRLRIPILSLALLGFNPTHIIWSDSLRAYGLGVFWILIAFGAFWRFLEKPGRWEFVLALIAALLSVQSILTNALLVFACGTAVAIIALRRREYRTAVAILLIGAVAALSLVPYVGIIQATHSWSSLCKANVPASHLFSVLGDAIAEQGVASVWIWGIAAIVALIFVCLWQIRPVLFDQSAQRRDQVLFALLAGGIGFLTTMIFFRIVSWPTNIWYYLPMLAVAAVAIDLIFDFDRRANLAPIVRTSVAIIIIAASFPTIFEKLQTRASNLDLIARSIAQRADPEDLIVFCPFTDGITFQRYFHRELDQVTIPMVRDLSLHRWDEVMEQERRTNAIEPVLEKVDHKLQAGRRVWVVVSITLPPRREAPPPVRPLAPNDSRPWTRFAAEWGSILAYDLRIHGQTFAVIDVPSEQSISMYEHSYLLRISGWHDVPPARVATAQP